MLIGAYTSTIFTLATVDMHAGIEQVYDYLLAQNEYTTFHSEIKNQYDTLCTPENQAQH